MGWFNMGCGGGYWQLSWKILLAYSVEETDVFNTESEQPIDAIGYSNEWGAPSGSPTQCDLAVNRSKDKKNVSNILLLTQSDLFRFI